MRRVWLWLGVVGLVLGGAALPVYVHAQGPAAARKGDIVHFVNETEPARGTHLAALVSHVEDEGQVISGAVFFEEIAQHPGDPKHAHIFKYDKAHDSDQEPPNTWHFREECLLGE